ncbi:NADH dehydrogenase [ubiquinone] 1 alpha subcomplex subunit 10, mitochondrial [Chironomus tepperi]|uniref:NADH dehydrogenase [ubiquinone] 1 alpha subcomplex subunit 10, mitochondrial n=1 Tax=Chironomus tepperi TaxID=113505 RepID=UPI00391F6326
MAGVLRFSVNIIKGNAKPLVKANVPVIIKVCGISGKTLRGENKIVKPSPFPYKTKEYDVWSAFLDKTTKRFDDNSKMICVEGPICSGKTKFAKELAEELEMTYMPAPTMDDIYVNAYGYDLRKLDDQLPENVKSFDNKKFCLQPNHRSVGTFQIRMYMLRVSNYIDALAHILSTGQGVVCNRSPYSDFVFVEALMRSNYISKGVRSVYYDLRNHTLPELMKPHLVIYLDVPVKQVKENIKKRKIDYEIQSKVFNDQYLGDIETGYKQRFLKDISNHAELLVYDWTEGGETEVVVEDIERIDFDRFGHYDEKMKDWRIMTEWEWCEKRILYTSDKADVMNYFNVPRFDVPELIREADDAKALRDVYSHAPGERYIHGYNADMGDSGILTKTKYRFDFK